MSRALRCRILIALGGTAVVIGVLGGLWRMSQGHDGWAAWNFGVALFNAAMVGVNWHSLSQLRGQP